MECTLGKKKYDLDKIQDEFRTGLEKLGWDTACEEDPVDFRTMMCQLREAGDKFFKKFNLSFCTMDPEGESIQIRFWFEAEAGDCMDGPDEYARQLVNLRIWEYREFCRRLLAQSGFADAVPKKWNVYLPQVAKPLQYGDTGLAMEIVFTFASEDYIDWGNFKRSRKAEFPEFLTYQDFL